MPQPSSPEKSDPQSLDELKQSLARNVRRNRLAIGMTKSELAKAAGIDIKHIGEIERSARNPTLETVWKIATALGVSARNMLHFRRKTIKKE